VAQHSRRDLSEPGELSDVQHDERSNTTSHGVRVKGFSVRNCWRSSRVEELGRGGESR
jgi:hypothetical protein